MSFAVSPKIDCPHEHSYHGLCQEVGQIPFRQWIEENGRAITSDPQCSAIGCAGCETWICMYCREQFCSRYEMAHMVGHYEDSIPPAQMNDPPGSLKHCLAFSLSDGSFWCYECDTYIYSPQCREIAVTFSDIKFPDNGTSDSSVVDNDRSPVTPWTPSFLPPPPPIQSNPPPLTFEELCDKLKTKQFNRVAVLTGAGISVAAGIPDFRTPGIGLYARVAELDLPELERPEQIFQLELFKDNPYPFTKIAKECLLSPDIKPHPVNAHHFIKQLNDANQLLLNYTQNIDGLELEAGLPLSKLVQAHGHMRSAHCYRCRYEHPMKDFLAACERYQPLLCKYCNEDNAEDGGGDGYNDDDTPVRKGYVKPDIVFFGESLPESFHSKFSQIDDADCVIVMGTSLKVYPFAFLVAALRSTVPIVVINRDNPGFSAERILFLPGEIEDNVKKIMNALGWQTV